MSILCELPNLIFAWTGLILSYGVFVAIAHHALMKYSRALRCGCRQTDKIYYYSVLFGNSIVFTYLFFMPQVAPAIMDVILVFDVFMTCALMYISVGMFRWHRALTKETTRS